MIFAPRKTFYPLRLLLSLLVGGLVAADGRAATIVWANNGGTWATGANWVGSVAPANSTVTDIASFDSGTVINPVINVQANINQIAFTAAASTYTITGSSSLIIGDNGIANSATNTQSFTVEVRTSTSQTWSTASGGTLVLGAVVDLNQTLATARTLTVSGAGNTIFNGVVQNSKADSTGNLALFATGAVTLAGANTHNGTTTLAAGTLNFNSTTALGTSTLVITGGALDNTSGSALTNANNNAQSWNASFTFVGTNHLNLGTGAVTLGANRQVTVTAGTLTVGGAISGTGFSLTKAGGGTLALSGASTYTGATAVSAGTLTVYGSLAASSAVSVASGGTLAGTGTVGGSVTVNSGGAIAPGSSPGTLTLGGSLTLNGGSALNFDLAGSAQDQLVLTGNSIALTGPSSGQVTINLLDYDHTVATGTYTLVSVVGTGVTTSNWSLGSFSLVTPPSWSQSYLFLGNNGHDLQLMLIPEPSAVAALAGVLAFLMARRRRR